jgi:hypothetical protein
MYLPFFIQNKDDVEKRDAGALRPDNRRWNYYKRINIFEYYNTN